MVVSFRVAGSVIVAAPMVAALVLSVFRLDELIGRPKGKIKRGRRFTGWDEKGVPVCEDPRPADYGVYRRRY